MTDLPAGRELDADVARRVMGWREVRMARPRGYEEWRGLPPGGIDMDTVPFFSGDIAAAWQVLEHLFAEGWALNIAGERGPGRPWDVRYWRAHARGMAFADTAPLAICRAALAAVLAAVEA